MNQDDFIEEVKTFQNIRSKDFSKYVLRRIYG